MKIKEIALPYKKIYIFLFLSLIISYLCSENHSNVIRSFLI